MLNFQSLVDYLLKLSKINENPNSTRVLKQYLRCNYTKFQLKILIVFRKIFQEYPVFCQFYSRNDREQNGAFTEMCEAL